MFCRAFIEAFVRAVVPVPGTNVSCRGCNSVAIVDLKEAEAEAAAKALVEEYGMSIPVSTSDCRH